MLGVSSIRRIRYFDIVSARPEPLSRCNRLQRLQSGTDSFLLLPWYLVDGNLVKSKSHVGP